MAAKKKEMMDQVLDKVERSQTYNPLLKALRENDKKNLFETNVVTVFHKTGFPVFDYFFGSVINMHDENGNIIKQEPRIGQAAGTFNLIVGGSGSGKSEPGRTRIPTPYGNTTMFEIQPGDYVFNRNGKPTKVLGKYPQGEIEVFKLIFNNNRRAYCSREHLWEVTVDGETKVMSLDEILKIYKEKIVYIPSLSNPVEYATRNLTIDPYILGLVVGFNLPNDPETEAYIVKILNNYFKIYSEDEIYSCINLYYKKEEIPEDCLFNDFAIRYKLLKGIVASCGRITQEDDVLKCRLYNENVLQQIQHLVRGFGYNSWSDDYHVYINAPEQWLKNLMDEKHKTPEYIPFDFKVCINYIELAGNHECFCIKVDEEDGLYVTEQFIITHNTTLSAQIAGNIIRQHPFANVIHFDCENRFDISRAENITKLPSTYFDPQIGERYMIKSGMVGLDTIQEMVVKTYINKMKLRKELEIDSGFIDEFGKPIITLQPTVIIIDSITTVINETLNPDNAKEAKDAESLRGNTEGARDAKTMKGFLKEVLPMCKEAGITIYGINHINTNMSMNAFTPVAKSQINLKQDEIIPGGKSLVFYSFNIIKLIPKASDNFTEETDGFVGHIVAVEPIKSSSNVSGNNSKGVSFEMVFDFKKGFDSLRTTILYGRDKGIIEGNKPRMKFKDDDSFTFSWKNIYQEAKEKPIWENLKKYVMPELEKHLSFINIEEKFDDRSLDY